MFYYSAVLRRHTGCFSTIWLVATKGTRVTRRDYLKVNVTKTCDDIMDYLLERVEPPRADLPRPRFSLYLSSQLQYGVILVYHRQCNILLEETQYAVDWLLKQKSFETNDMDDHRPAPVLVDVLSLMEQTEGAPDPLFGEMLLQESLPSPSVLLQGHLRDKSPAPSPPVEEALHRGITASPDAITLREPEPVSIPLSQYEGMELADHLTNTINLLLAETDQFPEGEPPRDPGAEARAAPDREEERGGEAWRDRTGDQTESTAELKQTITTLSTEDPALLPQEEPHLPAAPPVDQLTPTSTPVLPSPPAPGRGKRQRKAPGPGRLQDEGKKKRRRRQLIFADLETQLSQDELQRQISDPRVHTAAPATLPRPSARVTPAVDLLDAPSTSLFAEDLRLLWKRAAIITPLSGAELQIRERGPDSTDSEMERGREKEEERREGSSTEIPRDRAEAEQLDVSALGSLQLEASDQMDGSHEISPMFTPDQVSRSVSVLQNIPEEEAVEGLGRHEEQLFLELVECEEGPVSFLSLLSPGVNRRTVSHHFVKLLEDLSSRKLRAEQSEPYAGILISVRSASL